MPRVLLMTMAVSLSAFAAEDKPLDRFHTVLDPMVAAIKAGDYSAVGRDFAPALSKAFGPKKAEEFFKDLEKRMGSMTAVEAGRQPASDTAIFPTRFAKGGKLDIKLTLDANGKIAGLWFQPPAAARSAPKENATSLRLPFAGRWLTIWGGETAEQNQHHGVACQQFAMDFIAVDANGSDRRGQGRRNADYLAFGMEVLAPGAGVVTDVIEGVRDNVPGSMNAYSALGNAVFIEHAKDEVSVLAHFKQGSIRVRTGQKVKAGDVLGLCGNSGNSSQPHLHYHLQNTPVIQDATGIKCFFGTVGIVKDGKTTARPRHLPVKDEVVEPAQDR